MVWLWEAKYSWLALAVVIIALALALRPTASVQLVRLTGLGLQLIGILTVIWGISETRAFFGHPPVLRQAMTWMKRCPVIRRSVKVELSVSEGRALSGNVRAHVVHATGNNATVEERLQALEKNIPALHQRISESEREFEESARKVAGELSEEKEYRLSEDQQIRETLETTATGGVHISAIGAVWLLVGVTLSTAAPEIAYLIS